MFIVRVFGAVFIGVISIAGILFSGSGMFEAALEYEHFDSKIAAIRYFILMAVLFSASSTAIWAYFHYIMGS